MSDDQAGAPIVENAETVNLPGDPPAHPAYVWIVGAVTAAILGGFGWVTYAVLNGDAGTGIDAATKGSIIQTWNNLAVAAAAVWTGTKLIDRVVTKK